ncbi:MAG: EamA family transporter [Bacillota bacterium]
MNRDNTKVLLAYLAVCIIWGSTYLAIRIGVEDFPPFLFAGIRFLTAGSIMFVYAKLRKLDFPTDKKEIAKISIVGLLLLLCGNGLVVYAEQWVHSGIASLIIASIPLYMALIDLFIFKGSRLQLRGWLGLIIGFCGVGWLVMADDLSGAIDALGAILLLIACFCWALGSVFSKTFKKHGSIISQIAIEMLAGGAGLAIVGLIRGELSSISFTAKSTGALLYLIVFGSIIAYSSYVYILQKWPAAKAGTYAYINPVIAVVLGALILDEKLSISVVFSTVIILAGVFIVQKSKLKA